MTEEQRKWAEDLMRQLAFKGTARQFLNLQWSDLVLLAQKRGLSVVITPQVKLKKTKPRRLRA